MPTLIHPTSIDRRPRAAEPEEFRSPHYDCRDRADALEIDVFVPGVEPAGVEVSSHGSELSVLARKAHFIRVNWRALHLENAQHDYRLRLRLGPGLDFDSLHATLRDGVLTIVVPKRQLSVPPSARRVA